MKYFLSILTLSLLSFNAFAVEGFSVFAAGGTKQNGTNYVIVPVQTVLYQLQPVITYLSATGTNASSVLNFWTSTNMVSETATNSTTTLTVSSTNGFSPGTIVVIQHSGIGPLSPRFQYERGTVASLGTSSLVLVAAPANTTKPGDKIYQMTTFASLPIGVATVTLTGPGIVSGPRATPFLIDEGGSTNTTINALNVQFVQ